MPRARHVSIFFAIPTTDQDDETRCVPRALGVAAVTLSAPRFLSCGGQPKRADPRSRDYGEAASPGFGGVLVPRTGTTAAFDNNASTSLSDMRSQSWGKWARRRRWLAHSK